MQATHDNPVLVTPEQLRGLAKVLVTAKRPLFTWGSPGIGKTTQWQQIAEELGYEYIDIRASQWDAVDTRGVPFVTETDGAGKTTSWAIPTTFPREGCKPTILGFDELNSAAASVQAALYQLFDGERSLGDYHLPDNVVCVAHGNLETDRAVTVRMGTALASRFFHVQLTVDQPAWIKWALDAGIHEAILSYISLRPEHLHLFDPKSPSKTQPDPRGWEYVSDGMHAAETIGVNTDVESALVIAKMGEAIGAEFLGHLKIYRDLPHPDSVILAPDAASISDDPSVNYALCTALARRATRDNFDNIIIYAERLGKDPRAGDELMTLLVRASATWNPEVQQTKAFIGWANNNPDVLL